MFHELSGEALKEQLKKLEGSENDDDVDSGANDAELDAIAEESEAARAKAVYWDALRKYDIADVNYFTSEHLHHYMKAGLHLEEGSNWKHVQKHLFDVHDVVEKGDGFATAVHPVFGMKQQKMIEMGARTHDRTRTPKRYLELLLSEKARVIEKRGHALKARITETEEEVVANYLLMMKRDSGATVLGGAGGRGMNSMMDAENSSNIEDVELAADSAPSQAGVTSANSGIRAPKSSLVEMQMEEQVQQLQAEFGGFGAALGARLAELSDDIANANVASTAPAASEDDDDEWTHVKGSGVRNSRGELVRCSGRHSSTVLETGTGHVNTAVIQDVTGDYDSAKDFIRARADEVAAAQARADQQRNTTADAVLPPRDDKRGRERDRTVRTAAATRREARDTQSLRDAAGSHAGLIMRKDVSSTLGGYGVVGASVVPGMPTATAYTETVSPPVVGVQPARDVSPGNAVSLSPYEGSPGRSPSPSPAAQQ